MPRGIENRLQRLERSQQAKQYPAWRVYVSIDDALKDRFPGKKYIGFSPDDWDTGARATSHPMVIIDR